MRGALLALLLSLLFAGHLAAYVQENNEAVELMQEGRFVEGLALLKEARSRQPYDETIRRNLQMAYAQAGRQLVEGRRYEEAVELLEEAQRFDDTLRAYWVLRGYAFLRLQRFGEAEVELSEALGMGEPDAEIHFLLGQIYYQTDRMYEAFDALQSAALFAPEDPHIGGMLEKVRRELAVEQGMEKEYGGHFVITFEGDEHAELGAEVLDVLEEAYNWAGSRLDHYPEQRVTVILYSRQQFSDLTGSPDWAGGLYDGKIRLPVGGISKVNEQVRALLYHEYMHVVIRDIAGSNVPTWFNEGLAEVAERQVLDHPLAKLPAARRDGTLMSLQQLEGSFGRLAGAQIGLAYEQSYDLVRFLIEDYGWPLVRELLFALGDRLPIAAAVNKVFGIYGLDYSTLEGLWRERG